MDATVLLESLSNKIASQNIRLRWHILLTRDSSNSSCAALHSIANWMMDSALTFSRNEVTLALTFGLVLRSRILGELVFQGLAPNDACSHWHWQTLRLITPTTNWQWHQIYVFFYEPTNVSQWRLGSPLLQEWSQMCEAQTGKPALRCSNGDVSRNQGCVSSNASWSLLSPARCCLSSSLAQGKFQNQVQSSFMLMLFFFWPCFFPIRVI